MPVKLRAAKERRPTFSAEVLALFAALDRVPAQRQRNREFKDGERELARLLHLVAEWWTGNGVLDRSPEPCHPQGNVARADWIRCRAIRRALLQSGRKPL